MGAMGGSASPTTWQGDGTPPGMPRLPNGQNYQHGSQLGPAQTPSWYNPSMGALPTPPSQQWGAQGQVTYQGGVPAIKAYNQAMGDMRHAAQPGPGGDPQHGMMDSGYQQDRTAGLWQSMTPEQQAYWQQMAPGMAGKTFQGTQANGQGGGMSGVQQLASAAPWAQPAAPQTSTGLTAQAIAQLMANYGGQG